METEKHSAPILYIPHHLSEEVRDFPRPYKEDKMAKFNRFVRQENVTRFVADFSDDSQAATLTFENLLVSVSGKDPLVATQVVSFTLPTIENATDLRVQMMIRGFVKTEPGTRAVLVAHL